MRSTDEMFGQRPQPRPDFDDGAVRSRVDCLDDAARHARVGEKVLAEPLARPRPAVRQCGQSIALGEMLTHTVYWQREGRMSAAPSKAAITNHH